MNLSFPIPASPHLSSSLNSTISSTTNVGTSDPFAPSDTGLDDIPPLTGHNWEDDFYVDDNSTLDSSPWCGHTAEQLQSSEAKGLLTSYWNDFPRVSTATGLARRGYGGTCTSGEA
jgi:hypothetical protein